MLLNCFYPRCRVYWYAEAPLAYVELLLYGF